MISIRNGFTTTFSNIIELTRQIQIEETGKTRTDSDDVKSHEYLVTIPEGSGGFIWELLGMDTPDYDIRVSVSDRPVPDEPYGGRSVRYHRRCFHDH